MLRVIILVLVFVAAEGNECVQRSFGKDHIVCVCNSTYCDYIQYPVTLEENQYASYVSTMSGKRLQLSVNTFANATEPINSLVLIVDSNKTQQDIHGFGGAMTDAAALNIRTLSNGTQQNVFAAYFAPEGIGYSHCRIPIAGTDFSTRPYTYDDVPDDFTLSNFSLVKEDMYKINYLNYIKSIMSDPDSLRIFATAWSAPAWMKWPPILTGGFLRYKYYQLYANYTLKFFDAYKSYGINIWGMTPGNEPLDGAIPFFKFNAMFWSPSAEALWSADYLAPTLRNAGYEDLVYMAMDDQRLSLPLYPAIMFRNKKAKDLFHGIAVHWYADAVISPMQLTKTHDMFPDKFILMTEACSGSNPLEKLKVILGSWPRGEKYAEDIIQNLSHWVTGWIDWNMALNETGGPNWAFNNVDSPIIVVPESDEFYKQPMFYAISHFSKFVPRYSIKIATEGFEGEPDIKAISFLTPEKEIVTVIVNSADKSYSITAKDKNIESKVMNVELPARSFTTLLYSSE